MSYDYSIIPPPGDKEIVWNQNGAIIMNYETLVGIITGAIPFKVNVTENRIDGTIDTELIGPW